MAKPIFNDKTRAFLAATGWSAAVAEPLTGDASARKYFRLRKGKQSAVLMDASQVPETVAPFVRIAQHLLQLGFSAPAILARDDKNGLLLLEDFGDDLFSRLLDKKGNVEQLFTLATDVLIALHKHPQAVPPDLRRIIRKKCWKISSCFWNGIRFQKLEKRNSGLSGRRYCPWRIKSRPRSCCAIIIWPI